MSGNTTYLITGANRGLGKGMVEKFLARPATTVIAAVRNPSTANAIQGLPTGKGSSLIIVKIDSFSETDAAEAIETIQSQYQIHHLDIVIANAALAETPGDPFALTCMGITIKAMHDHFTVNTIGTLLLFRATMSLLEKSTYSSGPKFVALTSFAGSIAKMEDCPFPNAAYGPSKAGVNYLSRKIHFEHEFLTSFAINPGWVQTETGNAGAQMFGLEEAGITIEESVVGLLQVIDGATREKTSGKFMQYTGDELAW